MEHVQLISQYCTDTQLAFRIEGLERKEHEYEGFRIRIKGKEEWLVIPVMGTLDDYTAIITIGRLRPNTMYTMECGYKVAGSWFDGYGATFVTQRRRAIEEVVGVESPKETGVYAPEEELNLDKVTYRMNNYVLE